MADREALRAELKLINAGIDAILGHRRKWMDDHMDDFANHHVGDEIYDLKTGRLLGTITKLYRYWEDRDPRYDTSMTVEYQYRVAGTENHYDNTSRHGGLLQFGTAEQAAESLKSRAEYLALGNTDEERQDAAWKKAFEDHAKA